MTDQNPVPGPADLPKSGRGRRFLELRKLTEATQKLHEAYEFSNDVQLPRIFATKWGIAELGVNLASEHRTWGSTRMQGALANLWHHLGLHWPFALRQCS